MARFNLTIHGVGISKDAQSKVEPDIILSTEEKLEGQGTPQLVKKEVELINKSNNKGLYNLSLVNLQFHKKMYQPTEIKAEISVVKQDTETTWVPVMRDNIITVFKNKKVSLVDVEGLGQNGEIPDYKKVGEDFYIHAVYVKYKSNYMRIVLSIFSLDKQMTLENTCRTFVGKKLKAGILKEISNYALPYDKDNSIAYSADSMQNLSYKLGGNETEHIFPFLVQYNESFYDMLARTTNRWGEFMYYEGGKLVVGCPQSTAIPVPTTSEEVKNQTGDTKLPLFDSLNYYDVDDQEASGNDYDCGASYDDNMLGAPIRIDPNKVSGNILWPAGWWGGKLDKIVMKKFASFFKNDKNIPSFLGGEAFNDAFDLAKQGINVSHDNSEREEQFFTDEKKKEAPEQYAEHNFGNDDDPDNAMGYNPFSEIHSKYDKKKYLGILKNEISAGKDAICINYDTRYPCLKLGQIISVYDKEYIVIQIDCMSNAPLTPKDELWVTAPENVEFSFQVCAIAKQGTQFYPTVIPAGHVRLAEPQMATVTDADDPNQSGRVRVMFSWQKVEKDKDTKAITDETKDASSPWIQFTANAGGQKGIMGKHYEGDKVFVGFVDGNVERPYVMGSISKGAGADIHCTTPGGHQLKINDDEAGIMAFTTGAFLPMFGTLSDYIPAIGGFNPTSGFKNNLAMAGGFELSDNYGIYKISGSTDNREITIASTWGEVNINAFTGITISAPNGDVTIKGKNVTIEAGNNLQLTSGTNVKNKILGSGGKSGFMEDVSVAVAKKLADKVSVIDLSLVRSALDIIFRPAEGALCVKSNRFLMLEAGKGKCAYPKDAYVNEDTYNEKFDELKKDDFRKGLKLSSGIAQMITQITTIGKMHSTRYMEAYNKCVDKQVAFSDLIKQRNILKWRKNYKSADTATHKICNKYEDAALKDKFWADGENLLKEDDLGFVNEYSLDASTVTQANSLSYQYFVGKMLSGEKSQQGVIEKRKACRADILKAANELREAIIAFKKLPEITENDVKTSYKSASHKNLPKEAEKCLITAFDKTKLGNDVFFYKDLTADQKKLDAKYTEATMKEHRAILERKASILALEALGFKDEWREKKANPDYGVAGKPTKDQKYLNALKVERKFSADDLKDDTYWESYVSSLVSVPKLDALEVKAFQEFKKKFMDNLKDQKFWESWSENDSWGNAKNGGILFSTDCNIYDLKKNIETVPSPFKENLTTDDDRENDISTFLDAIKSELNKIKTV